MQEQPTEKRERSAIQYKPTIGSFLDLMEEPFGKTIRFNEMTNRAQVWDDEKQVWNNWTDSDMAALRWYFQSTFGMNSRSNLDDAHRIFLRMHTVNPLMDLLETLEWDGVPRMEGFLTYAMGCEDTPYTREVSRLIFAGGVHRAYRPGCKFDDMAVLIGSQGGGKSSIIRWLNIEDEYFKEVKTIEGKECTEGLFGMWIGEVAELMAMTNVKASEAVKAFVTRQEETYRVPYDRNPQTVPRRCIFIGTTNNDRFLTDKTGNRRFYPVKCHMDGYDVGERETEIRAYIRQCWAEAIALFKQDKLQPYARRELVADIREQQEAAMEDDWRVGTIRDWLDEKKIGDYVSVIRVWTECLEMDSIERPMKPTRKDSIEISQIIANTPGWEKCPKTMRDGPYKQQKVYVKVQEMPKEAPVPVETPDSIPF